ncbi:MAG: hypothetical protein JNJ57_08045 [Saprospiraceae bacterium]|nr:hypothetical protein [Saprospiraceae bacterium]
MKKINLFFCILFIALISCKQEKEKGNTTDVFTQLYSPAQLDVQTFTLDNAKGGTYTGREGAVLRISPNTFVDSTGKAVQGEVTLELKEVFTPIDRVLGNMTTTYQGKALETGGMIYVNARSGNATLTIAANKSISVAVPTDAKLQGMSLFKGKTDSTGVEWVSPEPINAPEPEPMVRRVESTIQTTNIRYWVEGYNHPDLFPEAVNNAVSEFAWAGDGLKLEKDTIIELEGKMVHLIVSDTISHTSVEESTVGYNSFREDPNTHYIFELKLLGWANIDRLFDNPATQEVKLITSIENNQDFKLVYVTLITESMYLPGYQKKDGTYSFSHDDNEPQSLPVGSPATILATAYVDGKPYWAIQKITIAEEQKVQFKLVETTVEKLKADLSAML